MRAIKITEFGGPDVLEVEDIDEPTAPDGFHLVAVSAAGINFADTHQAENTYLAPAQLPLVPGAEIVGTTADGRRVVAIVANGGYAEKAVCHPALTFDVPDGISDGQALALVLQGTTAWHLLKTAAQLRSGESVVVFAAAGGTGTLAIQLAKRFGAGRVIGVASSGDKRAVVERLGADATVDSRAEDLNAAIREANGGKKVDVILEMVGGDTFAQALRALAPFGRLVHFGQAGREGAPKVDPGQLMGRSQGVIGFWLAHMMQRPDLMREAVEDLFAAVLAGELEPIVGATYALEDAKQAHEDLRARSTIGKLVLTP